MFEHSNERAPQPTQRRSQPGWTLVELMVVLAIIGILAVIVYPSFREQVERTRRGDAKAVLVQNAQLMERVFTENGSYLLPNDVAPAILDKSPIDSDRTFYNIAFSAGPDDTTFTIQATPVGAAAGVGALSIDEVGNRLWDKNENGQFDNGEDNWDEHR